MMLAATLIGAGAGVAGLYLSYYAGVAAGASVAACIVVTYLAALAATEVRSLLDRRHLTSPAPPEAVG
jgi:ABC-type Mn2+/Zn2+ transport system permease subunit